jgi:hypothetical protein
MFVKSKCSKFKLADRRIEKIFNENCNNVLIPIMDIPKIFDVGRKAIAENVDDEELVKTIVAFVNIIKAK